MSNSKSVPKYPSPSPSGTIETLLLHRNIPSSLEIVTSHRKRSNLDPIPQQGHDLYPRGLPLPSLLPLLILHLPELVDRLVPHQSVESVLVLPLPLLQLHGPQPRRLPLGLARYAPPVRVRLQAHPAELLQARPLEHVELGSDVRGAEPAVHVYRQVADEGAVELRDGVLELGDLDHMGVVECVLGCGMLASVLVSGWGRRRSSTYGSITCRVRG